MNLDEILLNIKAVSFDSLVCQTDILSSEDKEELNSRGYHIDLTWDEFKEQFDINPDCVWYAPTFSMGSIYFNPETLAVCPLHFEMILAGMAIGDGINGVKRVIEETEKEVANGKYSRSIMTLPDAMRIEYFEKLIDKKGTDILGLYQLFISYYLASDYGFGSLKKETLKTILESKTAEDIEEIKEKVAELPDVVTIYRGGNSASVPYNEAYSWSVDINTANFFASRRGHSEGYIATANVKKEDILDYFPDGNENEVLVYPDKIKVENVRTIKGLEFIKEVLPVVTPMYQKYRDMMANLDFYMDSSIHGKEHQARVLLHCLVISELLGLPNSDRRVLATAAIYHDTQRTHDYIENGHGRAAREYYVSDVSKPDPLVEFLCEYHCLSDRKGYEEIRNNRKLSKNREKSTLLYQIFKDADGLDRIRLGGIRHIDLNQLRLDVSKDMTLVARMFLEQIRVD